MGIPIRKRLAGLFGKAADQAAAGANCGTGSG